MKNSTRKEEFVDVRLSKVQADKKIATNANLQIEHSNDLPSYLYVFMFATPDPTFFSNQFASSFHPASRAINAAFFPFRLRTLGFAPMVAKVEHNGALRRLGIIISHQGIR
jgi:hypothetical protein